MTEALIPAFYKPTTGKPRACFLLLPDPETVSDYEGKYYRVRPSGHTEGFTFYHESRVLFERDVDITITRGVRRLAEKPIPDPVQCPACHGEGEYGGYSYGGAYSPCRKCGGSGYLRKTERG